MVAMPKALKGLLLGMAAYMAMNTLVSCTSSGSSKDEKMKNSNGARTPVVFSEILEPEEKTAIKVWARGSADDPGVNAIIDRFYHEEKNIRVEYQFYGDNYADVVKVAFAAGSPPEVFEVNTGLTIPDLAKQDVIVPLDDIWTEDLKEQFHPDTLKQKDYLYQGKVYTIPVRISTYRLLYNKDLFKKSGLDPEKPPQTLEEMRAMAKRITGAGNDEYFGFGLPLGVGQVWQRVLDPISVAMGDCGICGFNTKTGRFDMALSKRLFNYYLDMKKDGSLFPGYATMGIDSLRANFSQGKIGMYIDGNWMVGNYAVQLKTAANWDIVPIPVFEGSNKGKYWAENGVNYAIAKSKKIEAAKKFYKVWITNQDFANKFMPVPRTLNIANAESNLPIAELKLQGVKGAFDTGDLEIQAVEPHKFLSLKGDDRNKVFTKLFVKAGDKDIGKELDAAIEDLNRRYNEALDKAIRDGLVAKEDLMP